MHDEPTPDPAERDAEREASVLQMLLDEDGARPWSFAEIDRELSFDPTDCLRRLRGAGLLHRLEDFYWPTRAALVAEQIKA
jgi:hypothetical protein